MAVSNLTLVLPPLTMDDSEKKVFSGSLVKKEKSLKSLRKLFSRGEKDFFDSPAIVVANLFKLSYTDPATFPVAAIMAMGAGLDATTGYWLCAEPVYLHADLDHVLLFDRSSLELSKQELAQLVSEIDEMLLEQGITTHHGHQQSLFFRSADKSDVVFTAIAEVSGKNILQHLPEGAEAAKWRLLQNEIQMQMSQSIVNQERQQRGLVSVNGLWFWGGGYLLRAKYKQVFDVVFANDLFNQGLARLTGIKAEKFINDFDLIDPEKNSLVAFNQIENTAAAWRDFLLMLEKNWIQPALALMKKGKLTTLTVVTGQLKITFSKQHLGKFWKRSIKASAIADSL